MAHYFFRGRNAHGEPVQGELDAINAMVAADELARRGIIPTAITEQPINKPMFSLELILTWLQHGFGRVPLEELVMFTRQMYALTKSGIPILRAVHGLKESARSPQLHDALNTLQNDLENGKPISSSLQSYPSIFSSLFVAIVHVGENTGRLDEAFLQLNSYLQLEMDTRRRIKTALRYPTFVIIALCVAMTILNMFVIPSFAGIFSRFHAELPWATKVLLAMSTFFQHFWWLLLIALVALVFGLRYWVSTSQGRMVWHHYQLKMPIIGSILQRALMARFCRCLAMMLRSGVPINQAMHLVAEAVDNVYISAHIQAMRTGVESGESLLQTAVGSRLFTPLVIQMIAVGEETGQIDTLMQESAEYYEREVDYDLQTLTSKIEPILIVMVAIMVLILALGIFTPMWDMMRVFKGQ